MQQPANVCLFNNPFFRWLVWWPGLGNKVGLLALSTSGFSLSLHSYVQLHPSLGPLLLFFLSSTTTFQKLLQSTRYLLAFIALSPALTPHHITIVRLLTFFSLLTVFREYLAVFAVYSPSPTLLQSYLWQTASSQWPLPKPNSSSSSPNINNTSSTSRHNKPPSKLGSLPSRPPRTQSRHRQTLISSGNCCSRSLPISQYFFLWIQTQTLALTAGLSSLYSHAFLELKSIMMCTVFTDIGWW